MLAVNTASRRGIRAGDALFGLFLLVYSTFSALLIPFDFTDLCYLISLEQGRWIPQEWVHPLYVPTLALLAKGLSLFGFHGKMLIPTEYASLGALLVSLILLYRLAIRLGGRPLAATAMIAIAATCPGFWEAAVRPTPYSLALLFQVISLSLLIPSGSTHPRRFYGLSGISAGLSMGYHAAAMSLGIVGLACAFLDIESNLSAATRRRNLGWYLAGFLAAAVFCLVVFFVYNSIDAEYFRMTDFQSLQRGIEQVPGRSLWSNENRWRQLTAFLGTFDLQVGTLARILAALLVWRLWTRARASSSTASPPLPKALSIATLVNLFAIGGFFLINGSHNGFIFASMTLIPVALALLLGNSSVAIAALVLLALPGTISSLDLMRSFGAAGSNDPQLSEAQFLAKTLGPRDIMLTPGSPFPEILYLAPLNIIEVSTNPPRGSGSQVLILRPGEELRRRVAWWRKQGSRVLYALGDETTDFTGDVSGAEKQHQIFWREETRASERAPILRAIRSALEASGLDLHESTTSPRGMRYADVIAPEDSATSKLPDKTELPLDLAALRHLIDEEQPSGRTRELSLRARYLAQLEPSFAGDPWFACDTMNLICDSRGRIDDPRLLCRNLIGCETRHETGQARSESEPARCFFGPVESQSSIERYLASWAERQQLGEVKTWGLQANANRATLSLELGSGKLNLRWELLGDCREDGIQEEPGFPIHLTDDRLQELIAHLPVAKIAAGRQSNGDSDQGRR